MRTADTPPSTADITESRASFRRLYEDGCFVLPNPWDHGSVKLMERLGFPALATSSSAAAWALGRPDYDLGLNTVLEHLRAMVDATSLPINADFESGFAEDPDGLARNVAAACATGIAGLSIEDRREDCAGFHDVHTAAERVGVARRAIDAAAPDVMLVARADGLLEDPDAVRDVFDRLVAFAQAGADCLYAPGLRRMEDVAAAVRAVAPRPLNVLVSSPWTTLVEMRDLGVRRVSVGGALAMAGWSAVIEAAEALAAGSFAHLKGGAARSFLEDTFAERGARGRTVRSSM